MFWFCQSDGQSCDCCALIFVCQLLVEDCLGFWIFSLHHLFILFACFLLPLPRRLRSWFYFCSRTLGILVCRCVLFLCLCSLTLSLTGTLRASAMFSALRIFTTASWGGCLSTLELSEGRGTEVKDGCLRRSRIWRWCRDGVRESHSNSCTCHWCFVKTLALGMILIRNRIHP